MRSRPSAARRAATLIAVLIVAAVIVAVVVRTRGHGPEPRRHDLPNLPRTEPTLYRKMVSAFTVSATMLRVGVEDAGQIEQAALVPTRLVPEEPVGWANLGLAYMRLNKP